VEAHKRRAELAFSKERSCGKVREERERNSRTCRDHGLQAGNGNCGGLRRGNSPM